MMRPQTIARSGKHAFTMLAVHCGKNKSPQRDRHTQNRNNKITELATENFFLSNRVAKDLFTGGQLEVHVLETCSKDELKRRFEELQPDVVYFLGECFSGTDDIGPLELADGQVTAEAITTIFGERLPQLVCLESSVASKLAEALHMKGVPYVVFWKGILTLPWAVHFCQAFVSLLKSSSAQIWNALQLADASFRLHYSILNQKSSSTLSKNSQLTPVILGDAPPNIIGSPNFKEPIQGDESSDMLLKVQIYEDEIDFPLLVLADLNGQDNAVLGALEDGLNAVLVGEVAGIRLLHRVSAPPPSSGMPQPARGVVTMRCDLCTSSSARISLLVAGSPQTCFDDQMLEYSIKKEILEKGGLVSSLVKEGENIIADIRKSSSIACGACVSEVKFRSSSWVVQILRQLSPDLSFRSLVALGIAGIQGFPVVPFYKEDTDRFLALMSNSSKEKNVNKNTGEYNAVDYIPAWLTPPAPTVKRRRVHCHGTDYFKSDSIEDAYDSDFKQSAKPNGVTVCDYVAAMKPVPHVHSNRDIAYVGSPLNGAWIAKVNVPHGTGGRDRSSSGTGAIKSSGLPVAHKGQSIRAPSPAQMLALNPIPMKKHGCNRPPMHECSEDKFKKDVMEFLISRGHGRLVPSQDVEFFPDAVLNGKRLDLYNLYKEVVSRGGFHVGNGINWKGQVFSKMRNHTAVNKMTGVGNTLKKHYETFLLEYELAHDDVDGECCILCHSSAAGDWVNCGTCGQWAHFGCDKRNGLGTFKDYAKTDGLEYTCPRCSKSNSGRKKMKNPTRAQGTYT